MRLLNSRNGQIKEFISAEDAPPYAILSHTWGEEEVTLNTWQTLYPSPGLERMKGYPKILHCQSQSLIDGLEWVWVDTYERTSPALTCLRNANRLLPVAASIRPAVPNSQKLSTPCFAGTSKLLYAMYIYATSSKM